MRNTRKYLLPLFILLALLLAGCNLGTQAPPTTDAASVYTQAAQTVIADLTQTAAAPDVNAIMTQAAQTVVAELTITAPTATLTPTPTLTFTPAPPSPTPTITNTPLPTATFTPTLNPLPCNAAQFVSDVTIPDGTIFPPKARFTKVWRLRNVGTCTWTSQYALAFLSGERMGAPNVLGLAINVLPGQSVDLSAELVAPNQAGTYRGNWMLRDPQGNLFGIGSRYNNPFWVQIRVAEVNSNYAYDFVYSVCDGEWSSGSQSRLPCPGVSGSADGSVNILDNPVLESGRLENEPALQVVPNNKDNGYIQGRYGGIRIQNGYRFKAGVMCADNAKGCDVIFRLAYREGGGQMVELGSWREVYDGQYTTVNVDLSFLSGKTIELYLIVDANGGTKNNIALWWLPHIE